MLIDADAVLALTVALERFELIAWRYSQITESGRRIEILELLACPLLNLSVETFDEFSTEYRFRPLVLERTNHLTIVTDLVPSVQVLLGIGRRRRCGGCECAPGVRTIGFGSERMERRSRR
jgi:hypothetical protein